MEPEGLRPIRGHTYDFQGVAHAAPMFKGERYCQGCHGVGLKGGEQGEPSCYQCHGKRWRDADPSTSNAPADHVVDNQSYMHHPNLFDPLATCNSCHGTELEGNGSDDTPSCFLCHEQLW